MEWTNQHGCGGNEDTDPQKQNCNMVLQFMCEDAIENIPGMCIFIPCHTIVMGYYGFTLDVHMSACPAFHSSVSRPSVFLFRMITSKHQWIFTKLGMCIDIMESWFGFVNGQI